MCYICVSLPGNSICGSRKQKKPQGYNSLGYSFQEGVMIMCPVWDPHGSDDHSQRNSKGTSIDSTCSSNVQK